MVIKEASCMTKRAFEKTERRWQICGYGVESRETILSPLTSSDSLLRSDRRNLQVSTLHKHLCEVDASVIGLRNTYTCVSEVSP